MLEIFQHGFSIGKCRFVECKMYHRKEVINTFHFGGKEGRKMEYSNSAIFTFFYEKLNRAIIIAKHFDGCQRLIFRILFSRKLKTSWEKSLFV